MDQYQQKIFLLQECAKTNAGISRIVDCTGVPKEVRGRVFLEVCKYRNDPEMLLLVVTIFSAMKRQVG